MNCLEILQYRSLVRGPRLIVLGAVHGNETCGVAAIRRIAGSRAGSPIIWAKSACSWPTRR